MSKELYLQNYVALCWPSVYFDPDAGCDRLLIAKYLHFIWPVRNNHDVFLLVLITFATLYQRTFLYQLYFSIPGHWSGETALEPRYYTQFLPLLYFQYSCLTLLSRIIKQCFFLNLSYKIATKNILQNMYVQNDVVRYLVSVRFENKWGEENLYKCNHRT